jgi:hypothetical protein
MQLPFARLRPRPTRLLIVTAGVSVMAALLGVKVSTLGVAIVGGSGIAAIIIWYHTSAEHAPDPAIVLPPVLLAVAGFELHLVEEYVSHYGPAISRLFDIGWTDAGFVSASLALALAAGLSLVALGLYYRSSLAAFVAWLFLISRLAELLLFVFPLLHPAIAPDVAHAISRTVGNGTSMSNMPNYSYTATSTYYFAGMYSVVLAIAPAMYAMCRTWTTRPRAGRA